MPIFKRQIIKSSFLSLPIKVIAATTLLLCANSSFSDTDHSHVESETPDLGHTENLKGPKGGTLLSHGNFSLEVTVFEQGIEPEMRVYAYRDNQLISPKTVNLSVTLERLGGIHDELSFSPENHYLVSDQSVAEPHSYDVHISANVKDQQYQWKYDNHEGRTAISERQQRLAKISTEFVTSKTLTMTRELFGVVSTPEDRIYSITAPYPGSVTKIHVQTGQQVVRGQTLLSIRNRSTLQTYTIESPVSGEVSERLVNFGESADANPLMIVRDLSKVWVEMSAFPEDIENLAIDQSVTISDMHDHDTAQGNIEYIAPQMTEGHIARARVTINNPQGHWRPGMHVQAEIVTNKKTVALAVAKQAIQSFRDRPVVFAKYDSMFEVRMVELGMDDGHYVEVLGGLTANTEYVTNNSFLLKADVMKDGASHDH